MKFLKHTLYIFAGILLISCNNSANNNDRLHEEEGHEHNENVLTYTLFSDNYEVFIEFPQLVKGEISSFTTHITSLSDYKPMNEGILTISLIKGNKGIRQTVDHPVQPGIFSPALKPLEEGIYLLKFEYKNSGKVENFEVHEVVVFENDEKAAETIQKTVDGNEISFLKEQAWKSDFGVKQLKKQVFNEVIETSGQLLSANKDEVTIVAPFAGIVKMQSSMIEGMKVTRGEQLLELTGKGLASENISVHYNQLKTNYEKSKANYERLAKLVDEKIVSEKTFLDAKTEFEQARVAFENVSSTGGGNVKSTLNGYVKSVFVAEGQFVEAGTPLVEVSQNQKLILRADVSHNHWHCLPDITEANFLTSYDDIVHNTREHAGRLISYGRTASNSAWSTPIYFEIENIDNLIPGSYIEVFLISKSIPDVIAIPKTALVEEQGNHFVFVQLNGEAYEKREVKTGISNGKEIEIISGLSEGEVIVTKGAYQVKLASMSSALPSHNHEH